MYDLNEMPVFQKTYDLYKLLHREVKRFPKGDRYSLGEKCKQTILELIETIIKAGSAKKEWKLAPLNQALVKLELIKVFVRLGHDTHCLTKRQYL